MKPSNAYKFCPRCGGSLNIASNTQLNCTRCGFKFYINPTPCNGMIIENSQDEILLVKRKYPPLVGFWDLPGGFIEPGEDLISSAKREIKEELTVDIEIIKIIGIYSDVYKYQNILVPTLGIVATAKITKGTIKPQDDLTDYQFFPKSEVLKQKIAFIGVKKGIEDYLKSSSINS